MLQRRPPAVFVWTPGRLLEHFESTFQFQTLLDGLGLPVLDECDRLVEMGGDATRCWTSWVRCETETMIFSARLLAQTMVFNPIVEEMTLKPRHHRIMVFFRTARLAHFAVHLFRERLKMNAQEIHGRRVGPSRMGH